MEVASYAPQIEAGETIYGWVSTLHRISGRKSAEETSTRAFGMQSAMRQHDLPPSAHVLAEDWHQEGDSTLGLLLDHTIAAYYWPFADELRHARLQGEPAAKAAQACRLGLNIATRTLPVEHPLKWCVRCCAEDQEHLGRAIWHVDHQFPTTSVCAVHAQPLVVIRGRKRRWMLPGDDAALCGVANQSSEPLADLSLAQAGRRLLGQREVLVHRARSAAIGHFKILGVMHDASKVHHDRIARWFRSTPVARSMATNPCGLAALADGTWIAPQLFRRKSSHAARWVALLVAIGMENGWSGFAVIDDLLRAAPVTPGGQRQLFDDLPVPYRAPDRVWKVLEWADSYGAAMKALNASRHDIGRWLKADRALHRMWLDRLKGERLGSCLQRLRDYLSQHPNATAGLFESDNWADVQWLRHHFPARLRGMKAEAGVGLFEQRRLFDEDS